ncbi:MAG: deoxyribodipyrimidine photolyase, partial [Pirellulaceae bacterium]|nr:deoxyribodipyrimidine photolyase [Pirellulaceae bacterium]
MNSVPTIRVRSLRAGPIRVDGRFVLYWMTANRRVRWNFALEYAVERCRELRRPLVVLETLEGGRRWSSTRHHQFVVEGMRINAQRLRTTSALYYPYLASRPAQVQNLLAAMGRHACLVVCDDAPLHEQSLSPDELAGVLSVPLVAVDSIGLLPMRLAERAYPTAYAFRRFVQHALPGELLTMPQANPLSRVRLPSVEPLPGSITRRWRPANELLLSSEPRLSGRLSIDTAVASVATTGGSLAAEGALRRFVRDRLADYAERRNHPDDRVTSELAPYLHFGHVSAHQAFDAVARHEEWSPDRLSEKADGSREGWWGMGESAEAFLDQLVTWRELGVNFA